MMGSTASVLAVVGSRPATPSRPPSPAPKSDTSAPASAAQLNHPLASPHDEATPFLSFIPTAPALQAPSATRHAQAQLPFAAAAPPVLSPEPRVAMTSALPFWQAVDAGDDVSLNKLCNGHRIDANPLQLRNLLCQRRDGDTMMMVAAAQGHVRVCRTLIKHGADAHVGQARSHTQQRRVEAERLTTPMALAAQHGHYAVVELLLRFSLPHHDALDSCYLEVEHPHRFAEVLHVLARCQRVSGAEWQKLLLHWVRRPHSEKVTETILFVTGIKPSAETMFAAAAALQPLNIRLLRDYGGRGDIVIIEEHTDSNSYHSDAKRRLIKKTPLQAALGAYTQQTQDAVLQTMTELCLAGARLSADEVQTVVGSKDLKLFRCALNFSDALEDRHLFTVATAGSVAILATLLEKKAWPEKDIEAAAVRAQDSALPQTLALLRAYQTVQRLRQTGAWSWAKVSAWFPGSAATPSSPNIKRPTGEELASNLELQEAQAYLALQLELAAETEQESFDASLPVPGTSAVGDGTVVLYRG